MSFLERERGRQIVPSMGDSARERVPTARIFSFFLTPAGKCFQIVFGGNRETFLRLFAPERESERAQWDLLARLLEGWIGVHVRDTREGRQKGRKQH